MARSTAKRLLIGNWKTYISEPKEAAALARALRRRSRMFRGVEVVLAPSQALVPAVSGVLKGGALKVAAQDVSSHPPGPHTGDTVAATLKALGVSYVIVGHSERRARGDNNEEIRLKLRRVEEEGMRAVLCVGEKERDAASGAHFEALS